MINLEQQLEELKDMLMVNSSTDFENHYDVTIRLIEIVQKQQAEIEELKK